jgi:hypothetical protein
LCSCGQSSWQLSPNYSLSSLFDSSLYEKINHTPRIAAPLTFDFVQRGFERYTTFLGARAILFFLGFQFIRSDVVSLKRSSAARRSDAARAAAPTHGDVIVSNHVDFVDILYFAFRYGAVFAFPARHWPSGGAAIAQPPRTVRLLSAIDALRLSFGHFGAGRRGPFASENDEFKRDAISIGEASERAFREQLGPIVLFAEGCPSNGRAVLPFVPVLANAKLPSRANVHVVALKYAKEGVAHEFVVHDGLSHVLWLLAQPHNSLTVLRLVADEQPNAEDACRSHDGVYHDVILGPISSSDDAAAAAAAALSLSSRIAGLLKVRRVAVSCADKHAFDAKWLGDKKEA